MKRDLKQVTDQMGLVALTNQLYGAFGLPSVTGVYAPQDVSTDTTAFEVRAVSNSSGAFKWTLGAFYKQHDFSYHLTSQSDPLTAPGVYSMISSALSGGQYTDAFAILSDTQASTKQTALFGETSYDISPQLQMQGGLRLFREQRRSTTEYGGVILYVPAAFGGPITPPGKVSSSDTDNIVNPRVTLSYKPMTGLMTYASASRGFRSGGQNDLFFAVAGSSPTYAPEKLTSLEVGLKSEHMDGRVLVDASLFSLDWTDLQTVIGEGPGGAGEVIGNIGKARSLGVEVSVRARPLPALELQASLSLLDAKTRNDVTLPDPSGSGSIVVASGARIPRTARQTANLAASYRKEVLDGINGLVRLSVSHVGESVAQLYRQDAKIKASTTLNLKAGVEGDQWSLYAYVNNLTDEKVQLFRDANDEPATGRTQTYWGRPRTVGLNLRYSFD
jgi:outer membrane receptor protein involved in Fe transport